MISFLFRRRPARFAGVCLVLAAALLLSARPGFSRETPAADRPGAAPAAAGERESWMNVFQGGRKIGYAHSTLDAGAAGYHLEETLFLRVNTLGMVQDLSVRTEADLHSDFTLSALRFGMTSGRFRFAAEGNVTGATLMLTLTIGGQEKTTAIPLPPEPYLLAGLLDTLRGTTLSPGETRTYAVFNPAALSMDRVEIENMGEERIEIAGESRSADKLAIRFSGMEQVAWIDESGEVLQESGLLGIRMVKTSRADALFGLPVESSDDLTEVVAVPSNRTLDDPASLHKLVVRITGADLDPSEMGGGRQSLSGDVVTIRGESFDDLSPAGDANDDAVSPFLSPSPFIQSDHPKIRRLAAKIVNGSADPLEKARKLYQWTYDTLEKRPVLSMPDAISTLENRMGDCNEHAMLLAALARAAGVPARVASGLVYMDGRFYYHAWNLLHVGKWITADATLGQFPADVTHIRFALGAQGEQMALMRLIGKIGVEVVSTSTIR